MAFVSSLHLFCAYNERITSQKLKFAFLTRNSKKKVVIKYLFDFTLNAPCYSHSMQRQGIAHRPKYLPSHLTFLPGSFEKSFCIQLRFSLLSFILFILFSTPSNLSKLYVSGLKHGVSLRTRIRVMVSGRTLGLTYNNKTPKFRKKK